MNKREEDGIETEDIVYVKETAVEEKILVFNPVGFILKMVISIAFAVYYARHEFTVGDFLYSILGTLGNFGVMYAVLSLFGLLVRLTKNYLVAVIMFILAIAGYVKLFNTVEEKGAFIEIMFNIVMTVILIAIVVQDVRKAILYFKYTK